MNYFTVQHRIKLIRSGVTNYDSELREKKTWAEMEKKKKLCKQKMVFIFLGKQKKTRIVQCTHYAQAVGSIPIGSLCICWISYFNCINYKQPGSGFQMKTNKKKWKKRAFSSVGKENCIKESQSERCTP